MGIATGHGTEGRCRLVVNVSGAPISPAAARDEGTRNGLRSLSLHSSFRFVLTHHAMSLVVFAVVKSTLRQKANFSFVTLGSIVPILVKSTFVRLLF